jgi:hypothetical protein
MAQVSYVADSSIILGNSKQLGNDCGLHTIILPILLQEELFLQVFGNTEREKKSCLVLKQEEGYFCHYILGCCILSLLYKRSWSWRKTEEERGPAGWTNK